MGKLYDELPGLVRRIRPAVLEDIPAILSVMAAAKGIMRADGNLHQWEEDNYPAAEHILADMDRDGAFVVDDAGEVVGYFAFLASPEPTYERIYDGAWLDDMLPYHVIHRIASPKCTVSSARSWISLSRTTRTSASTPTGTTGSCSTTSSSTVSPTAASSCWTAATSVSPISSYDSRESPSSKMPPGEDGKAKKRFPSSKMAVFEDGNQ